MKTIALDETTFERLRSIKAELGAKSFRETVQVLLQRFRKTPDSMFGAYPKLQSLTPEVKREIRGPDEV